MNSKILFLIFVIFTISLVETIQIADAETIVVPIEHDTIQAAINAASDDDIINIQNGIYDEAITLSKKLTINGEGNNTILQKPWILSANSTISNLKSSNITGTAFTITTGDTFVFDNITIENVGNNGIYTGNGATFANITIKNSDFGNNGLISTSNPGDLKFFTFEGNAKIQNVTIVKANQDNPGSDNTNGIEFLGNICHNGNPPAPVSVAGTNILENVTIIGAPNKNGILIQCYSDASGFSFKDVDLTGITSADPTKFWPSSLTFANNGTASTDIGNTKLNDLNNGRTNPIIATSADFGTTDNFEIERRVVHSVDHAGLSTVIWDPDNLYVRADFVPLTWSINADSNQYPITNAITAASDGFKINVKEGLYEIDSTITIDKSVTLLGPQADVDPRPSASTNRIFGDASEAIINGGGINDNIFFIGANNVTINGFEVKNGNPDLIYSEGTVIKNPKVSYNIIHDALGDEGIQLKDVDNALVEFNHIFKTGGDAINIARSHNSVIQSNEVHQIHSPDAAIYIYNDGLRDFINATIQNNLVYDITQNDGIKLGDKGGDDEGIKGGSILNNIVHDTEQDGITVYSSNVTVEGNEIFKSESENGALYVAHNVADITIKDNNIHDNKVNPSKEKGDTYGIRIGGFGNNYAISDVSVSENVIVKNKKGMIYESSGDATIDAKNNYWGSKKGPKHSTNTDANGDEISGTNITFTPFYIDAGVAILNDEISTAPGEEKTIKPTKDNVTFDDGDDSQKIKGQAALPEDIVEIVLKNNAVLDVNDNIEEKIGDGIDVGGATIDLKIFDIQLDDDNTTIYKIATDLTAPKKVANVKVVVEKAVKLKSGTNAEPIIIKNIDIPTVKVSIPDETTILAPAGWTGTIQPPKTASSSGTAPSGFSVGDTVIEVGSPDAVLLFDTPVTLTLEGVTGAVGYKPAGSTVWTQITESCGGTFENPDAPSFFPGECFISDGSDTKIVTYHFTSFGGLGSAPSASSAPAKSSSSGSGRTNVSPQEIAKKSNTSMSRVSDWVSSSEYFKIGVRDLISRGYIENVNTIPSQSPPDWFYSTGQAWKDGKITDEEYFDAVKWLIDNKILK